MNLISSFPDSTTGAICSRISEHRMEKVWAVNPEKNGKEWEYHFLQPTNSWGFSSPSLGLHQVSHALPRWQRAREPNYTFSQTLLKALC